MPVPARAPARPSSRSCYGAPVGCIGTRHHHGVHAPSHRTALSPGRQLPSCHRGYSPRARQGTCQTVPTVVSEPPLEGRIAPPNGPPRKSTIDKYPFPLYNNPQSDDGEGRGRGPSESRRAVRAGGKGPQGPMAPEPEVRKRFAVGPPAYAASGQRSCWTPKGVPDREAGAI